MFWRKKFSSLDERQRKNTRYRQIFCYEFSDILVPGRDHVSILQNSIIDTSKSVHGNAVRFLLLVSRCSLESHLRLQFSNFRHAR